MHVYGGVDVDWRFESIELERVFFVHELSYGIHSRRDDGSVVGQGTAARSEQIQGVLISLSDPSLVEGSDEFVV